MGISKRIAAATLLTHVVGSDLSPARGVEPAEVVLQKIVVPVQGSVSYSDDFGDPLGRPHP